MKHTFVTKVIQAEGKNATGFQIPSEIVEALNGGKRSAVNVQVNSFSYQTTIARYGDVYMLPLSQERREAAGVQAGDEVTLTLELNTEPRTVEIPDVLLNALEQNGVKDVFENLAYSKRKEFVRQVVSAKAEETQLRRIEKIITQLTDN